MNCSGLHCDGCGHSVGPGLGVAVAVGVLAAIIAKAHAIEHGISEVVRILVPAALSLAALIVAGTASVLVIGHRRRSRRIRSVIQVPYESRAVPIVISRAAPPALPPGTGRLAAPEPAREAVSRRDGGQAR